MNAGSILTKEQEKARLERESVMTSPMTNYLVEDFIVICGYSNEDAVAAARGVFEEDQKSF